MKKALLIGLLTLGSISSYAGILENVENDQVLDAIIDSLNKKELNCVESIKRTKFK